MANEEQLKRLKQGVQGWNIWRGRSPEQIDLSSANLSGADLSGADLIKANLSGANLSGANLSGAGFIIRANLSGANLTGADLIRANLTGADLIKANLGGVSFIIRANLSRANLTRADLSRADLIRANLSEANLSEADLGGVSFIIRANLSGANLTRADLTRGNLTGANLIRANLSEANLSEADLSEANLSEADLSGADLSGAHLSKAHLTRADLSSTVFAKNDLTSVRGLDTIRHHNPSRIDFRTVIFPRPGPILTTFLRGTGSSEYLIEAVNGRSFPSQPVSVKVFISFAPSDQGLCQNLKNHLSLLIRSGTIVLGQEAVLAPDISQWEARTSAMLEEAHVILLLLSAPFLASHQAWKDVIEPALRRHQQGKVRLIPIILRPTAWKGSSLAALQPLPTDGKPVTEWEQIDTPLTEVSEGLHKVVQPLHEALTEQEMKRRERDLVIANLIMTKAQAAEKQGTIQEQRQAVEKAEKTCQALQAQLQEAQQHRQDLKEVQETLLADLALLERTSTTLDEEVRALDTQIQSSEGMINETDK